MSETNKDLRIVKDGCIITAQIAQTLLTAVEKRIRIGLELYSRQGRCGPKQDGDYRSHPFLQLHADGAFVKLYNSIG